MRVFTVWRGFGNCYSPNMQTMEAQSSGTTYLDAVELSQEAVHPAAAALLPEPWWYDHRNEVNPFASDQGEDIRLFYLDWRSEYPDEPALTFAENWIAEAGLRDQQTALPQETQLEQLRDAYPEFVAQWEAEHPDQGLERLLAAFTPPDWGYAIREVYICTALAQLMAEGQVERPLCHAALDAVAAELDPAQLAHWNRLAVPRQQLLERLQTVLTEFV